jgi:hypothetical protein
MSKQLTDRLADAVRALAEGEGATLEAITLQPELMSLGCVVSQASDHGRIAPELDIVAGVMALLLEEAANSLDPEPHRRTEPNRAVAARVAVALEPGTQGRPLRGRRGSTGRVPTIARWIGYEPPSLFNPRQNGRSPFDDLICDMAEYLARREVAHRVSEQRFAQQARRPPLESAMRVDWLPRFEDYFRIWSAVSGLDGDIRATLAHTREGDPDDVDYFARKSLYYNASFTSELWRFQRNRGGLWILPDPAAEQLIADATWMIHEPTPLSEVDESMLRLAIAGWEEIATFMQATHSDPAIKRITASWQDWLRSCSCDLEHPNEDCAVHKCLHWTAAFMSTLEAQWDALADWYQVERPISAVVSSRVVE